MRIIAIEPLATQDEHRFTIRFDNGAVVEAAAHEVQDYRKFQRRVLADQGQHFRYDMAEYPRIGQREWSALVHYHLSSQKTADSQRTPAGDPARH